MGFFYTYRDTYFHNLGPMKKLFILLALAVLAMLIESPLFLAALFLISLAIASEARVLKGWSYYMKVAFWIAVFLVLLNLILSQDGPNVLFEAHLGIPMFENLKITLEAIIFGLTISLRLATVISAFALISLTISPEEILSVMARLHLPSKSVFVASLSARFVPSLMDDAEALTEVQKSRGAKLKGIRGRGEVIIPLLSNSLERSLSVAEAMESRGYDGRFTYDKD